MEKIAATEAQNKFDELVDLARRSPIEITKKGRGVVVMLACEEYRRLRDLEDEVLALRALAVEQEGMVSTKESDDLLKRLC